MGHLLPQIMIILYVKCFLSDSLVTLVHSAQSCTLTIRLAIPQVTFSLLKRRLHRSTTSKDSLTLAVVRTAPDDLLVLNVAA